MAQPLEKRLDVRPGGDVAFGERGCIGQRHKARLRLADVVKQDDRVERLELRRERILYHPGNGGMGLHTLERRQGCVIALRHPGAVPGLLHQLERGLKEIHKEPHAAIEPRQFGGRGNARVSAIAHHPSHDGAVLLLDMGLVVLAIRS